MGSVLSWAANAVLFVLSCFLVADTANEVIASLLTPPPETSVEPSAPPQARGRTWSERQIILTRNLFNSSTLEPTPPPESVAEEIEKSELPLTLLGTFASPDPAIARAALEEQGQRQSFVVRVGEDVLDGQATVIRIERRRVILSENGVARELTLEEKAEGNGMRPPIRTARAPRRPARQRPRGIPDVRQLADDRFELTREDMEAAINNPANLLTQARIMPKFEEGRMVGLEVSAIKSGSAFEEVGMQDGDVITEFNGIAIDSPNEGVTILQEFTQAETMDISGFSKTGEPFTKTIELSAEQP